MGGGRGDDGRQLEVGEFGAEFTASVVGEIADHYPRIGVVGARLVYSSVHGMVEVNAAEARYALKLYRVGVRTVEELEWEVAFQAHLALAGAPVAQLIRGQTGLVEVLTFGEAARFAVLSEWARGAKPLPTEHTYRLLGRAAGAIHNAADSFVSPLRRPPRDMSSEVDQQLQRLRPALDAIDGWNDVRSLGDVVDGFVSEHDLERGICHNDLTLDNVHVDNDQITVFDFDDAAEHWRASEAQGVYHAAVLHNPPAWDWWRAGYHEIRRLAEEDQRAVPYFVLMSEFENAAWRLGLTPTSVGASLEPHELGSLVDAWNAWCNTYLTGRS